jgi:hypothetical protein
MIFLWNVIWFHSQQDNFRIHSPHMTALPNSAHEPTNHEHKNRPVQETPKLEHINI